MSYLKSTNSFEVGSVKRQSLVNAYINKVN